MERTIFLEHYRICTNHDGSPHGVSRTGAAIEYKAIDTGSNETVRLQLIPIALIDDAKREQFKERAETAQKLDHVNIAKVLRVGVEDDHFVLVSEFLEGETADSWIVSHGPMTADAVLRVGLQVVRAIQAAAFFNLTHRAIQPANLKIVPGQSPDGGWPFVKVLNFGIAGLELHSVSAEGIELAPSISPQFASPEQLLNREIDFRSEMYSLGATMCFLLSGAAPLAVSGMKARLRLQRLPELQRAPKVLHNVLVHLLREDPENRPQDPVAFERELRECLTKIERRQSIGRKLGIPLAGVVPRKPKPLKEPATPLAQVLGGIAAFAVFLLLTAAAGAFFFPDRIPFAHRNDKVGVPVGVADADKYATAPPKSPAAEIPPTQNSSPMIAAANQSTPAVQANQPPTALTPVTSVVPTNNAPQVASADSSREPPLPAPGPDEESEKNFEQTEGAKPSQASSPSKAKIAAVAPARNSPKVASASSSREPEPPAAGPDEESPIGKDSEEAITTKPALSASRGKSKSSTPSVSKRSSGRSQSAQRFSGREQSERPTVRHGWVRARLIGYTADGRMILRLPSGRTVIARPRYDDDALFPPPRRRIYTNRPPVFVPPRQPFYPPDYPFDD